MTTAAAPVAHDLSVEVFHFYTRLNLVLLLGRSASTLSELLDGIGTVPGASIYYHTHHFIEHHQFLPLQPPNDFAYWVKDVLGEPRLGEKLASIDTVQFSKIEDLRAELIRAIERGIEGAARDPRCPEGAEFHFAACRTFVLPTPYRARTLEEFVDVVQRVSVNSLYFHIFEARLRLDRGANDFSEWLRHRGYEQLADAISKLDPYTQSIEGLRRRIVKLASQYGHA